VAFFQAETLLEAWKNHFAAKVYTLFFFLHNMTAIITI
jgi:hypothetical protein